MANKTLTALMFALLCVTLAGGCDVKMKPDEAQGEGKKDEDKTKDAEVIPVGIEALAVGPISRSLTGSGTLRGRSEVDVLSQSDGEVVRVLVDKGQIVNKGDVLAQLDDRAKRNSYTEAVLAHKDSQSAAVLAQLALDEQKHAIKRIKLRTQDSGIALDKAQLAWQEADRALKAKIALRKKFEKSVSADEVKRLELAEKQAQKEHKRAGLAIEQVKLDHESAMLRLTEFTSKVVDAKRAVEKAELATRKAQLELDKTRIKATIGGLVYQRAIEMGNRIGGGHVCYKIVDQSSFYLDLRMPEAELAMLREGQRAVLTASVLPAPVPGRLLQIDPAVEPTTGTVGVRIMLPDFVRGSTNVGALGMYYAASMLRRGMFIRARIQVRTHPRAKLVPQEAIVYEDQQAYVFTIKDGKAKRTKVELGFSRESDVEILTDELREGDPIVVAGQKMVQDDSPVKVIEQ